MVQPTIGPVEGYLKYVSFVRAMALCILPTIALIAVGMRASYGEIMWPSLIFALVATILFAILFKTSTRPFPSAMGVSGFNLALGFVLGPILATYANIVVKETVAAMLWVMVPLSLIGILLPLTFMRKGVYKTIAVLSFAFLLAYSQFVQVSSAISWVAAIAFAVFVTYEWERATRREWCWDKVIDVSGGIVLALLSLPYRFVIWLLSLRTQ
jgi:hypothetical protein